MRLKAQSVNDSALKARKDLARQRGELYLDYARKYLAEGQVNQALATVYEGIRLAGGPFYLAVQEQLGDLKKKILDNYSVHPLLQTHENGRANVAH